MYSLYHLFWHFINMITRYMGSLSRVLSVLSRKIAFEETQFSNNMVFIFFLYRVSRKVSKTFLFLRDAKTIDTRRIPPWLCLSSAIYLFRDTLFVLTRQKRSCESKVRKNRARARVFHDAFSWAPAGLVYFLMREKNSRLRGIRATKFVRRGLPLYLPRGIRAAEK